MAYSPGGGLILQKYSSKRKLVTRFFTGMLGSKRRIAAAASGPATSAKAGLFFTGIHGSSAETAPTWTGNFTFKGIPLRFAFASVASLACFLGVCGDPFVSSSISIFASTAVVKPVAFERFSGERGTRFAGNVP